MCVSITQVRGARQKEDFGNELPEIGRQVKLWRNQIGVSQSELEQQAGLSHNAISRIETNAHSPRLETLEKISVALNISLEELQYGLPKKSNVGDLSEELHEIMDRVALLPTSKRRKAIETFEKILDLNDTE